MNMKGMEKLLFEYAESAQIRESRDIALKTSILENKKKSQRGDIVLMDGGLWLYLGKGHFMLFNDFVEGHIYIRLSFAGIFDSDINGLMQKIRYFYRSKYYIDNIDQYSVYMGKDKLYRNCMGEITKEDLYYDIRVYRSKVAVIKSIMSRYELIGNTFLVPFIIDKQRVVFGICLD